MRGVHAVRNEAAPVGGNSSRHGASLAFKVAVGTGTALGVKVSMATLT